MTDERKMWQARAVHAEQAILEYHKACTGPETGFSLIGLDCPFCGRPPSYEPADPRIHGDGWSKYWCANRICPAHEVSVVVHSDGDHRREALTLWNTRVFPVSNDPYARIALGNALEISRKLLVEARLASALKRLLDACRLADNHDELSDHVDGEIMNDAEVALRESEFGARDGASDTP